MSKIQFPAPQYSPFTDLNGQVWEWNDVAWVRKGLPKGVEEAPNDGFQYARVKPLDDYSDPNNPIKVPGYWERVTADEWYLGAFDEEPIGDNFSKPLQQGHTYYNLNTATVYVWDGGEWDAFSGVSEIATLAEFRWDSLSLLAGEVLDVKLGDEHGNTPVDAWILGQIIITIYKDTGTGLTRLIEQRPSDGTSQGTWDPSGLTGPFPGNGTANLWDWWVVTADGSYDGASFLVGEVIQAITDNPSTTTYANNWRTMPIGTGLDAYDYTIGYDPNLQGVSGRTVTFTADIISSERIVIETGTLAASEYIKTTFQNASTWGFINAGVLDPLDITKLPVQKTVADYIKMVVEAAEGKATQALIGSVFPYAGQTAPVNALICNGQEVSINDYSILYARIGTTWDIFNGMPAPSVGNFRVPPQEVNGFPLYYAGSMGANPVSTFLPNQNENHTHLNTHSHTGSVSSAIGGHDHYNYWRTAGISGVGTGGGGKTIVDKLITKSFYESEKQRGSIHAHRVKNQWVNAGTTGSSVNISESNAASGSQGGSVAQPNTAIMLMCIWADIQVTP